MYTCPVCEYTKLEHPPQDFEICPCCGTEFDGLQTQDFFDAERMRWVFTGKMWWSNVVPPDLPTPSILRKLKDYPFTVSREERSAIIKEAITEIERLQQYERVWNWTKGGYTTPNTITITSVSADEDMTATLHFGDDIDP